MRGLLPAFLVLSISLPGLGQIDFFLKSNLRLREQADLELIPVPDSSYFKISLLISTLCLLYRTTPTRNSGKCGSILSLI